MSNYQVYVRLLKDLMSYWKTFSFAVLTMIIASATTPIFALLTKPLIDKGFVEKDPYYTIVIPLAIVLLFFVRGLANYCSNYLTTYLSNDLVQKVRIEIYNKINHLPISYFKQEASGHIVSKVINDANQITDAGFNIISILAKDGVVVLGLLATLFYLDWKLTLISLATLPFVALLIRLINSRLRQLTILNQKYMGNMTQSLKDTIGGIKEVKIYDAYAGQANLFRHITNAVRLNLIRQRSANSLSTSITQLIIAIALAVMIYFAGVRAQSGFTAGSFMAFVTAMIALFDPVKRMTDIMQSLQRGMAGARSVFEFLDLEPEEDKGTVELQAFTAELQFSSVYFQYADAATPNLKDINLTVKKGQMIALVGSSGCGKSTLVNLIPRFFPVTRGQITLDGININDFTLKSLRRQIALVSQDVFLFDDTVAKNVAFGHDDYHEAEVIAALQAANAWEFVEKLPEGINTAIGENGSKLSGGQRQRLVIARAILKNAPILILDEATSALDTESEKMVQKALDQLMRERTTIVIAHRLSTIERADLIVVMDKGKIIETGKHQELLQKKGRYRALYELQFN